MLSLHDDESDNDGVLDFRIRRRGRCQRQEIFTHYLDAFISLTMYSG